MRGAIGITHKRGIGRGIRQPHQTVPKRLVAGDKCHFNDTHGSPRDLKCHVGNLPLLVGWLGGIGPLSPRRVGNESKLVLVTIVRKPTPSLVAHHKVSPGGGIVRILKVDASRIVRHGIVDPEVLLFLVEVQGIPQLRRRVHGKVAFPVGQVFSLVHALHLLFQRKCQNESEQAVTTFLGMTASIHMPGCRVERIGTVELHGKPKFVGHGEHPRIGANHGNFVHGGHPILGSRTVATKRVSSSLSGIMIRGSLPRSPDSTNVVGIEQDDGHGFGFADQ
mmetsp:Transcript_10737/g.29605  ORF Transcript_10737/g.29605 Transcript_10737/m.29605 type:complete len:278 (+) Transcript_10737:374-1207(+)